MNPRQLQAIRRMRHQMFQMSADRVDQNDGRALAFFLSKNRPPETQQRSTAALVPEPLRATRGVFVTRRKVLLGRVPAAVGRRGVKLKTEGPAGEKPLRAPDVSQATALERSELTARRAPAFGLTEASAVPDKALEARGAELPAQGDIRSTLGIQAQQGIGSRSDATVSAGIDGADGFAKAHELAAYVGAAAAISGRDKTHARRPITEPGIGPTRAKLVRCTLNAVRCSNCSGALYQSITAHPGAGNTISETARTLLSSLCEALKKRSGFQLSYPERFYRI